MEISLFSYQHGLQYSMVVAIVALPLLIYSFNSFVAWPTEYYDDYYYSFFSPSKGLWRFLLSNHPGLQYSEVAPKVAVIISFMHGINC